jgi:hypothetical protein
MWVVELYKMKCPICGHGLVCDYRILDEVNTKDEYNPEQYGIDNYIFVDDYSVMHDMDNCEHVVVSFSDLDDSELYIAQNHRAQIPRLWAKICHRKGAIDRPFSDAEIEGMAKEICDRLDRREADPFAGDGPQQFFVEVLIVPTGGGPKGGECATYTYIIMR